jgi:hypothetical protein
MSRDALTVPSQIAGDFQISGNWKISGLVVVLMLHVTSTLIDEFTFGFIFLCLKCTSVRALVTSPQPRHYKAYLSRSILILGEFAPVHMLISEEFKL